MAQLFSNLFRISTSPHSLQKKKKNLHKNFPPINALFNNFNGTDFISSLEYLIINSRQIIIKNNKCNLTSHNIDENKHEFYCKVMADIFTGSIKFEGLEN